jgi:hypothetical protein
MAQSAEGPGKEILIDHDDPGIIMVDIALQIMQMIQIFMANMMR